MKSYHSIQITCPYKNYITTAATVEVVVAVEF